MFGLPKSLVTKRDKFVKESQIGNAVVREHGFQMGAYAVLECEELKELIDALEDFKLGHEHAPDLPHTRAMGDTYGWCDYCSTRVSWGPGYAEQILAKWKTWLEGK